MNSGVEKVLVLSTAHMPGTMPDFGDSLTRWQAHNYGYILFVPIDSASHQQVLESLDETCDWLKPILQMAFNLGCSHINFDQESDQIDGLETWDW